MNVISHRGAKGLAPENSLESIYAANKLGPDYIEFDIQTTKDNVVVLFHDKSTPSGKKINDYTLSVLEKEVGKLTTLKMALKLIDNSRPLVELKQISKLGDIISELSAEKNTAFTSFKQDQIISMKNNCQGELFLMQHFHPFGLINLASKHKLTGIGVNKNWLFLLPFIYSKAKKRSLKMYIYTLNNIFLAKILNKLMPEIYICTDRPDELLGQ